MALFPRPPQIAGKWEIDYNETRRWFDRLWSYFTLPGRIPVKSIGYPVTVIGNDYTITINDYLILCPCDVDTTVKLPASPGPFGQMFQIGDQELPKFF